MNPTLTELISQMQNEYENQIKALSRELRGSMGPKSDVSIQREKIRAQQQTLVDLQLRLLNA